jgi:hypothetical protein
MHRLYTKDGTTDYTDTTDYNVEPTNDDIEGADFADGIGG